MFRATMGPSSGETTVFMRHFILVILCGWLYGMQGEIPPCISESSVACVWSCSKMEYCRMHPKVEPRRFNVRNKSSHQWNTELTLHIQVLYL